MAPILPLRKNYAENAPRQALAPCRDGARADARAMPWGRSKIAVRSFDATRARQFLQACKRELEIWTGCAFRHPRGGERLNLIPRRKLTLPPTCQSCPQFINDKPCMGLGADECKRSARRLPNATRVFFCAAANMDTLGFEPRAFRMRSGCDTITPCAQ